MIYRFLLFFALLILSCHDTERQQKNALSSPIIPEKIKALETLSQQFPDSAGIQIRLVDAWDSIGRFGAALSIMDSLLSKDNHNYGLWFRKAQLQEHAKDTAGAIRSYNNALKIYPAPDGMLSLANLLAEKKDSNALHICRNVAVLRMGRTYQAHCDFISGIYYSRTGQFEQAIRLFNSCILNNYTYMSAYMEKGFILYDQKKLKDAAMVFETVIAVKNNDADGYYWLAKCREALNDKAAAIENYQKALALDPDINEAKEAIKRLK